MPTYNKTGFRAYMKNHLRPLFDPILRLVGVSSSLADGALKPSSKIDLDKSTSTSSLQTRPSLERQEYLKDIKHEKYKLLITKLTILFVMIISWELAAEYKLIDQFITSRPTQVFRVLSRLYTSGELMRHLLVTMGEVVAGFAAGTLFGTLIAIWLWISPFWSKVAEPYLVVINSLPKIALGPLFIVWLGAGPVAIVGVTLSISMVVTILEVLNGFINTDREKIALAVSFGASRLACLTKVVLPANITTIISALKISVGMSWVGVIVGEFLVSRAGIGYLIVYGSQVFQLDLVMAGVVVLGIAATVMYLCVGWLERRLVTKLHF